MHPGCSSFRYDDGEDDEEEWSKTFDTNDSSFSSSSIKLNLSSHGSIAPIPSTSSTLKSTGFKSRVVIHIDIDCFYAQVEMLKNPDLRDQPLGVRQKNLVVTSNYRARALGLAKCSSVKDALVKVPDLVLVNGEDLYDYRIYSQQVFECIMDFVKGNGSVERLGMDENFVDVTSIVDQRLNSTSQNSPNISNRSELDGHVYQEGCSCDTSSDDVHLRIKVGSNVASELRALVKDRVGLTCSAGIAENKLLSKIGGGQHKPNEQTSIFSCQRLTLMNEVHFIRRIPGIGKATSVKLKEELQIETIEDARQADEKKVAQIFDPNFAQRLRELSMGIDRQDVKQSDIRPQSLGLEDRFMGITCTEDIRHKLQWLLGRLCKLLLRDKRIPMVLKVTCRDSLKDKGRFHKESRQCRLESLKSKLMPFHREGTLAVEVEKEIVTMSLSLVGKMIDLERRFHITLLGMAFSHLKDMSSNSDLKSTKGSIKSFLAPKNESQQNLPEMRVHLKRKAPEDTPSSSSRNDDVPHCKELLPSGWDREVFEALPQDIRNELLLRTHSDSSASKCDTNQASKSLKRRTSGDVKASHNSILNYFKPH